MSSMFGDGEKDYIYDEIGYFLEQRSLSDLMDVISWVCRRFVIKDYESEIVKENAELKKELEEIKNKISKLVDDNG